MARLSEHGIRLSSVRIYLSCHNAFSVSYLFEDELTNETVFCFFFVIVVSFQDEPFLPEQQFHKSHVALQRRGGVNR